MQSNLFLCILLKDDTSHVSFNLDCIDIHFGRFDTSYSIYRVWELETISVFFKNLGLLQYCILIIYVMKSLLFPCAYNGFVYVSNFLCKKKTSSNHVKIRSSIPHTAVHRICVCV